MRKANVLRAGFGLAIVIGLLFGEADSTGNRRATEATRAALLVVAAVTADEGASIERHLGPSAAHESDPDRGCRERARHRR
jgi:hypothetical protein